MNRLLSVLLSVLCVVALVKGQSLSGTTTLTATSGQTPTCTYALTLSLPSQSAANDITLNIGTGVGATTATVSETTSTDAPYLYPVSFSTAVTTGAAVSITIVGSNSAELNPPVTVVCNAPAAAVTFDVDTQPTTPLVASGTPAQCSFSALIITNGAQSTAPTGAVTLGGTGVLNGAVGTATAEGTEFTYALTFNTAVGADIQPVVSLDGSALTLDTALSAVTCNAALSYGISAQPAATATVKDGKCSFTATLKTSNANSASPTTDFTVTGTDVTGTVGAATAAGTEFTYAVSFTTAVGKNIVVSIEDDGDAVTLTPALNTVTCNAEASTTSTNNNSDESSSASILSVGVAVFFSALIALLL